MFDERLLERLDATTEVRRDGRSAVLRRAAEEYLRHRRRFAIAEGYRAAYGDGQEAADELGGGFANWEDEGVWPAE